MLESKQTQIVKEEEEADDEEVRIDRSLIGEFDEIVASFHGSISPNTNPTSM